MIILQAWDRSGGNFTQYLEKLKYVLNKNSPKFYKAENIKN